MAPPRGPLRIILYSGIDLGPINTPLDVEASLALLLGPMLYSHIFLREQKPVEPELGSLVAQAFWRAFSIPVFTSSSAKGATRARRIKTKKS